MLVWFCASGRLFDGGRERVGEGEILDWSNFGGVCVSRGDTYVHILQSVF